MIREPGNDWSNTVSVIFVRDSDYDTRYDDIIIPANLLFPFCFDPNCNSYTTTNVIGHEFIIAILFGHHIETVPPPVC